MVPFTALREAPYCQRERFQAIFFHFESVFFSIDVYRATFEATPTSPDRALSVNCSRAHMDARLLFRPVFRIFRYIYISEIYQKHVTQTINLLVYVSIPPRLPRFTFFRSVCACIKPVFDTGSRHTRSLYLVVYAYVGICS